MKILLGHTTREREWEPEREQWVTAELFTLGQGPDTIGFHTYFSVPVPASIPCTQSCHVSGKCQGKTKFSPGQGKVKDF